MCVRVRFCYVFVVFTEISGVINPIFFFFFRKGEQCVFNRNGIDIVRLHGQTFGYGMRCDCMEGKVKCVNTRV